MTKTYHPTAHLPPFLFTSNSPRHKGLWRLFIILAGLGAALAASAADMTPIAVSGFNSDVVIESTASGPPYSGVAVELNPGENLAFYESGLAGKSYGLPAGGSFLSALGDNTTFQFQSYAGNNALILSSSTGLSDGTLFLSTPQTYARLAILANSASGGGTATVTLNFADGSSYSASYLAWDWFNNSDYALLGMERINLSNGGTSGAPNNPRFYQTTLDLTVLLGSANKPIASITFSKVASAGSTAVYAVSGEIAPPAGASILVNPVSTSAVENGPAGFSAVAGGTPSPSLQWLRNGTLIAGATNASYSFFATLADHNANYRMVASNLANSISFVVTSAPAVLTVSADIVRPVLLNAQPAGLTQVLARFSERLKPSTATNAANYALSGGIVIAGVSLDASQSNVVISVSPMTDNALYTLTVNNVADQAVASNAVTNNSQVQFYASVYASIAIGSPAVEGSQVPVGNGLNVSGSGADIGGTSDQYQFSYVQRTGDFDVKVRLDSLSLADAWSEAGLLVREALTPGARSASVMATPSISGCYFQARGASNGVTTVSGSFPANYPNTWLRLKRVGNDLTGYAGIDGQSWTQLGTATLALPATVYFGFAVSSHNASQLTTAAFRDFGNVTSITASSPLPFEALGQSTRRTSLVISEIMYHPTNAALEFVELFNTRGEPQDLSGYKLRGDADFNFPAGTVIPGGGFVVIAKSPVDLQSTYGITGVLGPYLNSLPNGSGTVRIINQAGGVILETKYSDTAPWPAAADGTGHSLVLAHASYGEKDPQAWALSDVIGGSPGRLDSFTVDPLRNVCINEFLAHTDDPEQDYIELYNHSTQAVNLAGCVLSDDPALDKFVIPGGTIIAANGFVVFNQTTLGFSLAADGETIYFKNAARARVIDAIRFGGQENGVATGRYPNGADQFYRLTAKTPGASNASIRVSDVVINELMYRPISGKNTDQYIELYNRSGAAVDLSGWTLGDGVSFGFPNGTTIPANGYLVVANSRASFLTNYPTVNPNIVLGDFGGNLSGSGERVTLEMPDSIVGTNGAVLVTNYFTIVMDEVNYRDGGRWGQWADGGGSSLERIDPRANSRLPSSWADSNEVGKAPWSLLSVTGTIDNGNVAANQLQVLLQGSGECLIDNVEVRSNNVNLIANSSFETDATGWTAEGTESRSGLESAEGYASSRSYHVRAVQRGDNEVNRIRVPLTSTLASGTTNVTIRANVRWLKGHPQIIFRLRGNWLECMGTMALPVSPGTPGAVNSRFANAAPAITKVQHSPVLPQAGEAVLVTAQVEDPDGVTSLQLNYRLDPSPSYTTVTMTDNGAGGDLVAGDGVFSAAIPGQATGSTVAFYLSATDNNGVPASSTFPNDAPDRECLVRIGEVQPSGNFPTYRLWMTQATLSTWTARQKLDNSPFPVTFVLDDKRVIYKSEALYAGSPYIAPGYSSPTSGRCGYSVTLPADDEFLGETGLVIDWPGGHGGETTAMQEQMAYWTAEKINIPFSHRYTIRLHVNGVTDTARQAVFEAVHQPGGSFLEEWSPNDSGGQFFKVERAFEFNDSGGLIADTQPRAQIFTTTGGAKKTEKYRWSFLYRANDRVDDYTGIFAMVDALNAPAPEPYTSATMGLIDVEEWMRIFAMEHIIVNFDAWGHDIGKNMYAYKPQNGKWQIYMFDLDWLMMVSQQVAGRPPESASLFTSEDPTIATMYAYPPFARAYWRAVEDVVNGPFDPAKYGPAMDSKYQSLLANGIAWCDGQPLTGPTALKTWFSARRTFLQNQLATVATAFSVNSTASITNGVATITGTAPVGVVTIAINGTPWQIRWTGVNTWTATVALQVGSNLFNVTGLDKHGTQVAGAAGSVSINYGGSVPSPVNSVVINEIMYAPALANAEFVELFNTSTNFTFDLSGWEANGLNYVFPGGSFIAPQSYLVLAKDRTPFNTAFGSGVPVFDSFGGNLQSNGETISLLKPGAGTNQTIVVDRVKYETTPPWPSITNGASLQLRDATQDNSRVANWTAVSAPTTPPANINLLAYTGAWKYMQVSNLDGVSWSATAYNDAGWPSGAGLLAFENNALITPLIQTVLLSPATATNNAASGHAYYFRTKVVFTNNPALYTFNASAYVDDGAVFYVNGTNAYRLRMAAGTITNLSFSTAQPPGGDATTPDTFVLPSNLFVTGTNVIAVEVHQNQALSSDITFGLGLDAVYVGGIGGVAFATPGAANSVQSSLTPFPTLWLNEVQADNLTGPLDNFSQHDPWVEIFNPGPSAVSLAGYYLATNYSNLAQWAFPSGSIPAGGFLTVWCDNQTGQTVTGVPHTNFRLNSGAGSIVLSRLVSGTNQVLDYLNYNGLPANWSYGDVPDAQPFYRENMFFATASATNNAASPPLSVFINEWMADNTLTLVDPANGKFDDWFELYNPGTNTVDVGGYYLTDNLTNKFQFLIPNNGHYLVPPGGYLLVWADNGAVANSTNIPDLHANFALSKGGEAIGLFAADGTQIDAITFGAQVSDVSEGRFPNGAAAIFPMPTPTPRAANVLPNTPPSLTPISSQEVTIGQTLTFTATATDPDVPAQTLMFTLGAGAPAGATITPLTGQFSWKPSTAPASATISVIVTDNGTPTLSATQTFNVTVHLPPTITTQISGNQMQLAWPRGTLQEANEVTGPYLDVTTASPFVVDLTEARKFYRIKL